VAPNLEVRGHLPKHLAPRPRSKGNWQSGAGSHRLGRFKSSAYKYNIFYIYCIDFVLLQAERESGEPRVDAGAKQL